MLSNDRNVDDRKKVEKSVAVRTAPLKGFVVVFLGAMTMLGVLAALGTKTDHQQIRYSSSIDGTKDYLMEPLESRTGCVKRVHIFGSDREMRHIPELNKYTDLFRKSDRALSATDIDCMSEGYDCDIILTMGGDVDYLEGKDAVVFGLVPTEFRGEGSEQLRKLLKLKPGPGQTWIYFSTETPLRVLRWTGDLNFSRLKYHLLMTYDLDSDIVVPFGFFRPIAAGSNGSTSTDVKSSHLPDPLLGKEGMIAWMASNCHGQFWPRVEFIKKMRDILPLDDYGTCGRKECLPKRSEECNKLMARYKFFFALPNSECKDYITEKFWLQSLSYGTVPVVLGSQKESYEKVAPPNSFIHISDFESDEDFVKYLHRLNEDEEAYRRFYEWRNEGEVVITFPTRPTILCRTLPHLQEQGDNMQYKYLSDSPWFNGCRRTPDRKVFDLTRDEEKALFQLENWSVWR